MSGGRWGGRFGTPDLLGLSSGNDRTRPAWRCLADTLAINAHKNDSLWQCSCGEKGNKNENHMEERLGTRPERGQRRAQPKRSAREGRLWRRDGFAVAAPAAAFPWALILVSSRGGGERREALFSLFLSSSFSQVEEEEELLLSFLFSSPSSVGLVGLGPAQDTFRWAHQTPRHTFRWAHQTPRHTNNANTSSAGRANPRMRDRHSGGGTSSSRPKMR